MNTHEIISLLKKESTDLAEHAPDAVWYLFGSILADGTSAADIDVLIIYSADHDAIIIRRYLEKLLLTLPIHLLLIRRDEENELNFVATQQCIQIYPELNDAA